MGPPMQIAQVTPPAPHAFSLVPATQVPLEQQPLEQFSGVQRGAPQAATKAIEATITMSHARMSDRRAAPG